MSKSAHFKLVLSLVLFLNYSQTISAEVLISKSSSRAKRNDVSTKANQLEIDKPGEKWIVVNEISCWESNGQWENDVACNDSKTVRDHRFRFFSRTGLTGIQFKCAERYEEDEKQNILEMVSKDEAVINLPRGDWENWTKKSHSSFAVGFAFAPGEMSLRRSVKNFDMIYHTENPTEIAEQSALNSGKVVTKCPETHAICGVTAMMDKTGLGILTSIGLKCCFHCVPEEKWEIFYELNNTNLSHHHGILNTTFGLQRQPRQQNIKSHSANSRNTLGFLTKLQNTFSSHFGKSDSTGFDWTATPFSTWTNQENISKSYFCEANSTCLYKQLVGQCGSVRVRVDEFCRVSVPVGSSIPDECNRSFAPIPITSTTPNPPKEREVLSAQIKKIAAAVVIVETRYRGSSSGRYQYNAITDGDCTNFLEGIKSVTLTGTCVALYQNQYCKGARFQLTAENADLGQESFIPSLFPHPTIADYYLPPRSIGVCT